MFEKEAEEYVMREDVSTENDRVPFDNGYGFQTVSFEDEVKKAFKDGAEFGYNKANEWHYVKEGDLPKDTDEKLCFYEKGKVVARYGSEYNCWETSFNGFVTVIPSGVIIAWKEIVPPKEIKEK